MKNKFKYIFVIFFLFMLFFTSETFAHSGRTDSNGGHRDNKNVSGLGSYHYHCGGNEAHLHPNGICPYSGSSNTSNTYNNINRSNTSINEVKNNNIEAENISITDTFVPDNIEVGDNFKLQANILPYNTTDKTIYWESSNNDIVTIDSDGNLKATSRGVVTITAKTVNGKQDSITLNVKVYPKEIKIEKLDNEVFTGEQIQLKVNIVPEDSETILKWSSSNDNIVKVDENGNINALKYGQAIITVTTDNMKTDSIVINVRSNENSFLGAIIILFVIVLVVIVIKYRKNFFKKSNITEEK